MSNCLCGASDCQRCHPDNFEDGVLLADQTCVKCDGHWDAESLEELEESDGLCPECRVPNARRHADERSADSVQADVGGKS